MAPSDAPSPWRQAERDRFDALVEEAIGALPGELLELIEELPVLVEDFPSREQAESLLREWRELPDQEAGDEPDSPEALMHELCGLHEARAYTEESVEAAGEMPGRIMLFRAGILAIAGGWAAGDDAVFDEIAVTLLHEIGHQFGLDEDDLDRLGYA